MSYDSVFSALADAHRRDLLDLLYEQSGQSVSQLAAKLSISRQATDKHLRILEHAELVVSRRVGRQRLHYLNPIPFKRVAMRWLSRFETVKLHDLMPAEDE